MIDQINPHGCKDVNKIWPAMLLHELLELNSSFLYIFIMNDICRAVELLNNCQKRTFLCRQNQSVIHVSIFVGLGKLEVICGLSA